MKKKISILLAVLLVLSLTSCSNGRTTVTKNQPEIVETTVTKNQPEIVETTENTETSEDIIDTANGKENTIIDNTPKVHEITCEEIVKGQLVSVPNFGEFTLDKVQITTDVMPPKPSSWYTHYEAERGKQYVDICFQFKNLDTRDIEADEVLFGTLYYSGLYEYSGFSMIEEENRSDFTYSNITSIAPLSTEYVHYLFLIPDEVANGNDSIVAVMALDTTEYKIVVRDGTTGNIAPFDSSANGKTSGLILKDEIVSIQNLSQFKIDYVDVTSDVMPPRPDSWYTHYEAENGKCYVDFCFAYKNYRCKSIAADDVVSGKLVYDGAYEYSGFSMIEENNRSDFTYSNITAISPLCTEYMHYLFSVPDEVRQSGKQLEIEITIDNQTYNYEF